jgi:CopG family nickel-responsive transcriptional regulator
MGEIEGGRTGTIIVIYDLVKRGLIESIARLQQDFREIIRSTMLLPLNNTEKFRLELLLQQGDGRLLVTLAERILRLNGVRHVKLTTIKPEDAT